MLKRLTLLLSGAAAFVARPLRIMRPKRTTPQMVLAPAAAQVVRVGIPTVVAAVAGVLIKQRLDRPSRPYEDGSVGREYDAWTREGILEHYWGEHIHLGYYTDEELDQRWFGSKSLGFLKKNFIEAKYNFTQRMLDWGGVSGMQNAKILDVGCGIGGTTRYMANLLPNSTITGITLSPEQAKRATDLAQERNVPNARFQVMDALAMDFPDDTFDLVWACESGEHMPDKKRYVEEMVRVLKPGGRLVIATWCQRSEPPAFTHEERVNLTYLYEEWAHPYFISIDAYAGLLHGTGAMEAIATDDWTRQTIASWRHSVWAGVWDPIPVFSRPKIWYKTLRDIVCLERMHRAFDRGLMQYGMIQGIKKRRV